MVVGVLKLRWLVYEVRLVPSITPDCCFINANGASDDACDVRHAEGVHGSARNGNRPGGDRNYRQYHRAASALIQQCHISVAEGFLGVLLVYNRDRGK